MQLYVTDNCADRLLLPDKLLSGAHQLL